MDDAYLAKNILVDRICLYCAYSSPVFNGRGNNMKEVGFVCTFETLDRAAEELEKYRKNNLNEMVSLNPLDFVEETRVAKYDTCKNWRER